MRPWIGQKKIRNAEGLGPRADFLKVAGSIRGGKNISPMSNNTKQKTEGEQRKHNIRNQYKRRIKKSEEEPKRQKHRSQPKHENNKSERGKAKGNVRNQPKRKTKKPEGDVKNKTRS